MRRFEDFLNTDIVVKTHIDLRRAKNLVEEAKRRKDFLKEIEDKIEITDKNANYFIENCYDIILELIRSRLLLNGLKTFSHEAEVAYLRNLGFSEKEVEFMNQLRYFRNGIKYYGKEFDKEYAQKVLIFLDRIYQILEN